MKKLYSILFVMFGITSYSSAQPILTASNTNYIIGDNYTIKYDTVYQAPIVGGANQTWDYSALILNSTIPMSFFTAAGTAFPAASLYGKNTTTNDQTFYTQSASAQEITGNIGSGGIVHTYSDPQKSLTYPFQMGSTFTDNFAESYTTSQTFFRKGTTSSSADAYGTLKLPNGNFNNVLRVKTVQNYSDSVVGFGIMFTFDVTYYSYYLPGFHQPILTLSTLASTLLGQPGPSFKTTSYVQNITLGINDVNGSRFAKIDIYPNPSSNQFSVELLENSTSDITFYLKDITGKNINVEVTKLSSTKFVLNAKTSASGVYNLVMMDKNKVLASRKIQIQN